MTCSSSVSSFIPMTFYITACCPCSLPHSSSLTPPQLPSSIKSIPLLTFPVYQFAYANEHTGFLAALLHQVFTVAVCTDANIMSGLHIIGDPFQIASGRFVLLSYIANMLPVFSAHYYVLLLPTMFPPVNPNCAALSEVLRTRSITEMSGWKA